MIIYSILALLCSILYSVSAVFCKYGLQHNIELRTLSLQQLVLFLSRNKIWIIGVLMSGVANIAMIQIQARIDVSIVFSLLNFSYIFILVLGHYFLKEHLNNDQWLGVGTVILGTVMILGVSNPASGRDTDFGNLLFLSGCAVVAIGALIYIAYSETKVNYEIIYAVCTGISFACVETYLKASTNMVTADMGRFSIFSLDSIKHFLSIWPFFVMFAFGAVGWLFLQITYSHGNVSVTMPVVAVTQRIVSMSGGFFVYGEQFTMLRTIGLLTIVLGVAMLIFSSLKIAEPKTV